MKLSELQGAQVKVVGSAPGTTAPLKLSTLNNSQVTLPEPKPASDKGSGPPILSFLAIPGQVAGKVLGNVLVKGAQKKNQEAVTTIGAMAQRALKNAHEAKDQKTKDKWLKVAQDAAVEMKKVGYQIEGIDQHIQDAQRISIPGVRNLPILGGDIPALSDNPGDAIRQMAGRGTKAVGFAGAGVMGAAGAGALYGAGEGIEEGASVPEIALKAGEYAAGAKLGGWALGKVAGTAVGQKVIGSPLGQVITKGLEKTLSPLMAKPAEGVAGMAVDQAFRKFGTIVDKVLSPSAYLKAAGAGIHAVGEATGLAKTPEEETAAAQSKIEKYWTDAKTKYTSLVKYDKNSPAVLAREGIIPGAKGGSYATANQAEMVRLKAMGERATLEKMLETSGQRASFDELKKNAVQSVTKNFQGVERQQALKYLEKQFEALASDYGDQIVVHEGSGDRTLPLKALNDIKTYLWSQGYASKIAPTSDRITAATARIMGNAAKVGIQDAAATVEDGAMRQAIIDLNERSGELFQAAKFLDAMNGRRLPNGLIGRQFARVVGAVIGSHSGPVGGVAGAVTADKIVEAFSQPNFSVGKAAEIMAQAAKENPAAIVEAERIIAQLQGAQAASLKLPGPSATIFAPAETAGGHAARAAESGRVIRYATPTNADVTASQKAAGLYKEPLLLNAQNPIRLPAENVRPGPSQESLDAAAGRAAGRMRQFQSLRDALLKKTIFPK